MTFSISDPGRCASPGCINPVDPFSNIHSDPATCNMNYDGTPTGCLMPDDHHEFRIGFEAIGAERKKRGWKP
jgi:hypothetical protein